MTFELRDATAVVGVGSSRFTMKQPDRSNLRMAGEALREALEDAGMAKNEIDGLALNGGRPWGIDYDELAEGLGIDADYTTQTWSHGRFAAPVLQTAATAIACGLATRVACINVSSFGLSTRVGGSGSGEEFRETGGPHGEVPAYGQMAPMSGYAMVLRLYQERFGVTSEKLATVPLTTRRHANMNPRAAMYGRQLTLEEYLAEPYVIEPLRRYDCALTSNGAVCMLVTSRETASDYRKPPIFLMGMQGLPNGRRESRYMGLPGLGLNQDRVYEYRPGPHETLAFRMAKIEPTDVDGLYIYDHFSPAILIALERFGYCRVGEAADFIQGGRIALGGQLPINTNGGHLSEAHVNGWNHMAEIVHQLRGEGGDRQIQGAEILPYVDRTGAAIVFRR